MFMMLYKYIAKHANQLALTNTIGCMYKASQMILTLFIFLFLCLKNGF